MSVAREWASRDLEDYRNGYPGQDLDNARLQNNFLFYSNELKSQPSGDFVDQIHKFALNMWLSSAV